MHSYIRYSSVFGVGPSTFARAFGGGYAEGGVGAVDWRAPVSKGGFETSGSSIWRADHTFSSAAAGYSLKNFIEPEIEAQHPQLSKKDVQQKALEVFQQRLKQDLSFEHQESNHVDTTVRWTIVEGVNGKKELATAYGGDLITLSQLWEHTKAYAAYVGNTAAYNREEERAQLAMQDAFISNKAHGFISVISHPDAVRYVQVWEKTADGDIASQQVDLYKTTGRDFSHVEAEAFINRLTTYQQTVGETFTKDDVSYAHLLLASGTVTVDDIKAIAVAHVFIQEPLIIPIHTDMIRGATVNVANDLSEAAVFLGDHVHRHIEKRMQDLQNTFVSKKEREGDVQHQQSVKKGEHNDSSPLLLVPHESSILRTQSTVDEFLKKSVGDIVAEWVFEQRVLSVGKTENSLAIATLSILTLKLDPPSLTVGIKSENLSKEYPTYAEYSIPSTDTKYETSIFHRELTESFYKPENEPHDVHASVESVRRFLYVLFNIDKEIPVMKREGLSLFIGDGTSQQLLEHRLDEINQNTYESVEQGILFIFESLVFLARESGDVSRVVSTDQNAMPTRIDEQGREVKEPLGIYLHQIESRAAFSMVIWLLLQGVDRIRESDVPSNIQVRSKRDEYFVTTPWVLLSIIWYLTMLRESGMQQSFHVPVVVPFPLSGVIYMYIHDRISS